MDDRENVESEYENIPCFDGILTHKEWPNPNRVKTGFFLPSTVMVPRTIFLEQNHSQNFKASDNSDDDNFTSENDNSLYGSCEEFGFPFTDVNCATEGTYYCWEGWTPDVTLK